MKRYHVVIEFDDPDLRRTHTFVYTLSARSDDDARNVARETFFLLEGRTLPIGRGEWRIKSIERV